MAVDEKDLEQALRALAAGKISPQFVAATAPPVQRELLRRSATVRSFDRLLVESVLRRHPAEIEGEGEVLFKQLVASPVVQRVPSPKGTYRIAQVDRPAILGPWEGTAAEPSLRPLREKLLAWYQEAPHAHPVEALYQLAWLDPDRAAESYKTLFSVAESRSDLRLCDELISLFIEAPRVPDSLRRALEADQARINARALWADDFYRTGNYIDRATLAGDLTRLMKASGPETWVYQIYAAGGSGKTMFVRWALSRWCVSNGVPCARIDFDHADPTLLATRPERLALELARAWNEQIPGKPLTRLIPRLSASDATASATQPLQQLGSSLTLPAGVNALVVLDTVEEVLIPLPDRLNEILGHLAALHKSSGAGATHGLGAVRPARKARQSAARRARAGSDSRRGRTIQRFRGARLPRPASRSARRRSQGRSRELPDRCHYPARRR